MFRPYKAILRQLLIDRSRHTASAPTSIYLHAITARHRYLRMYAHTSVTIFSYCSVHMLLLKQSLLWFCTISSFVCLYVCCYTGEIISFSVKGSYNMEHIIQGLCLIEKSERISKHPAFLISLQRWSRIHNSMYVIVKNRSHRGGLAIDISDRKLCFDIVTC
jgi:hypothetical protein